MNKRHTVCTLAAAFAAGLLAPLAVQAADYPVRPIEIVVPSSAGGGTDVMARLFAEAAKKLVPQPIVVSNKPGAGGGIGMTEVARAAPDGYKIGVIISELAIIPHLNMTKTTTADFIPIARLNGDPGLIAVRTDSPHKTIDDLLAAARKDPGAVSMGNAGTGTIWHLAAAAVEQKTHVRFNHVPFQGAAPSVLALVGGHVDAIAVSPAEIGSHVAAGNVRVLVSMGERRSPAPYDQVATFKEKGVDLVFGTWRGLGAPLKTPPEVVRYLRDASRKIGEDPAFKEALQRANLQPAYLDGEAFLGFMNSQSDYFKGLLASVDLKK
ncbi:tripartite tricarboxylate transporter substrate binding protein [Pseudorhodoferax sp. Leaf274]|uniref:tripartite tricarboxylate transporter substrate binding protein n=1 Tax=Pseudorhodoferax sp. Leaf274 TaxID=1736318 RepID=UPI000702879F|nr:tripartite tricarboxylate transporter substrate binding protein [Pseudorhodoferax sp. Leaf274]KQP45479.1 ABC transporter substrate-binding protein [Pseudorhodoferax sp. Leaf274]